MANLPTQTYSLLQSDVPTTVVNGATGTGTGKSFWFTVPDHQSGQQGYVSFVPVFTGTVSACTATVQTSEDGGTTTASFPSTPNTTLTFGTNAAPAGQQVTNLTPGRPYRLTIASLTGGGSAVINAVTT